VEAEVRTYWHLEPYYGSVPIRSPRPVGALSADGVAYVTHGDEYQILAVDDDADAIWALRVDYQPVAPTADDKEAIVNLIVEDTRNTIEGLGGQHFVWPERYAAIENLEIDGHGNIYVFPHTKRTPSQFMETSDPVPVDVYSADGERLFSGMSPIDSWDTGVGEYVYRVETDSRTEERVVARYRLLEPF
jgi:hypothetical protein